MVHKKGKKKRRVRNVFRKTGIKSKQGNKAVIFKKWPGGHFESACRKNRKERNARELSVC